MTPPTTAELRLVTREVLAERQRAISNAGGLWPPLNEVITPWELSDLLREVNRGRD